MSIEIEFLSQISKLFIPVIAGIGAYIAYQQHVINREKIKFELFEKRFHIFKCAQKIIQGVLHESEWEEIHGEPLNDLKDSRNESIFICNASITNKLDEIIIMSYKFKRANRSVRKDQNSEQEQEALKFQDSVVEEFEQLNQEIILLFKPLLTIDSI